MVFRYRAMVAIAALALPIIIPRDALGGAAYVVRSEAGNTRAFNTQYEALLYKKILGETTGAATLARDANVTPTAGRLALSDLPEYARFGKFGLYELPEASLAANDALLDLRLDDMTTRGKISTLKDFVDASSTTRNLDESKVARARQRLSVLYMSEGEKEKALPLLERVATDPVGMTRKERVSAMMSTAWLRHARNDHDLSFMQYVAIYDQSRSDWIRAKCLLEMSAILYEKALSAKGSLADVRWFIGNRLLSEVPINNDPDFIGLRARAELILAETYYSEHNYEMFQQLSRQFDGRYPSQIRERLVLQTMLGTCAEEQGKSRAAMDAYATVLGMKPSYGDDVWGQEAERPWKQTDRAANLLLNLARRENATTYIILANTHLGNPPKVQPSGNQ